METLAEEFRLLPPMYYVGSSSTHDTNLNLAARRIAGVPLLAHSYPILGHPHPSARAQRTRIYLYTVVDENFPASSLSSSLSISIEETSLKSYATHSRPRLTKDDANLMCVCGSLWESARAIITYGLLAAHDDLSPRLCEYHRWCHFACLERCNWSGCLASTKGKGGVGTGGGIPVQGRRPVR